MRPEFDADFAYHFGIPKPIIAAVNGPAAGVGFVLACYCDLRFAAAGAKLTTAHGRLGLPAEYGLSWLLPRLVGLARAADLLLSSRVVLAEEAGRWAWSTGSLPPDELLADHLRLRRELATEVSPASLAATKLQLYLDLHRDVATSVRDAGAAWPDDAGRDFAEGVAALTGEAPAGHSRSACGLIQRHSARLNRGRRRAASPGPSRAGQPPDGRRSGRGAQAQRRSADRIVPY